MKNAAVLVALASGASVLAMFSACSSASSSGGASDDAGLVGSGEDGFSPDQEGDDASATDATLAATDGGSTTDADMADAADVTDAADAVDAAPIGTIVISPATASVPVGYSQPYLATLKLHDGGSIDVTKSVTWSTGDAGGATILNAGLDKGSARPIALGTTTIMASDPGGSSIAGTASIVGNGATLTNLLVSPNPGNVLVGKTLPLVAFGTFSDATMRRVTTDVSWTTGDPTLATIDARGVVTGVKTGPTFSQASNSTKTVIDTANLNVQ